MNCLSLVNNVRAFYVELFLALGVGLLTPKVAWISRSPLVSLFLYSFLLPREAPCNSQLEQTGTLLALFFSLVCHSPQGPLRRTGTGYKVQPHQGSEFITFKTVWCSWTPRSFQEDDRVLVGRPYVTVYPLLIWLFGLFFSCGPREIYSEFRDEGGKGEMMVEVSRIWT